jgi:SPP1 family predicted phage head-tail adaptor
MANPGTLSERVTFRRAVTSDDDEGGYAETWENVLTVWASVTPQQARKAIEADQLQMLSQATVMVRLSSDVRALLPGILQLRLRWQGREYVVTAMQEFTAREPFVRLVIDRVTTTGV